MIDNTTDAFRSAMQAVLDMAPAAPDMPRVEGQAAGRRPVVALAGSFALVLIVVGVGGFLLAQRTDGPNEAGSGIQATPTTVEPTPTTAVLQWNARSVVVYGPESGLENGCAWRLDATGSGTWMIGPCGLLEFTVNALTAADTVIIPSPLGAMSVAVATDGTVWIGNVDAGVVSYNGESLFEHEIIAPWVEVTRDGTVWARRLRLGLASFDGVAWVDEPDAGAVSDLAVDDGGTLWVATQFGIKELSAGGWVAHEPPEDISMMDLIAAPDGIALFNDDAVLRFDGSEWTLVAVPSLADLGVDPTARYEDEPLDVVDTLEATDAGVAANGDVWIASTVYGALRYRDGTWVRFTTEDGLASNHLTFVEVGPDGSVWFGSDDAGLTRLLP
jgi:ligand-binding sensor domain-containing protein